MKNSVLTLFLVTSSKFMEVHIFLLLFERSERQIGRKRRWGGGGERAKEKSQRREKGRDFWEEES